MIDLAKHVRLPGTLMSIVRRDDRQVVVRGPRLPTLQRLVDRASGSEAVTVLSRRADRRDDVTRLWATRSANAAPIAALLGERARRGALILSRTPLYHRVASAAHQGML